ncbi:MAG: peptidoglycan DD-metalloendopeptidase family protein [Acutalibacteraceae bacterium]|jgi:murein DD-endopeptidase MepM/ murein hydrolase activator NlpD
MNNPRYQRTKEKRPLQGKGFYIAMAACLIAIGTAAWMTFDSIRSLTDVPDASSATASASSQLNIGSSQPDANAVDRPVSGVPANPTSSTASVSPQTESKVPVNNPVTASSAPTVESKAPTASSEPKNKSFLMPVAGKVTKPFGDSLYSLTFGDWRAHRGVDLAASKGSNVLSIGEGTVTKTFADDMLGYVVVASYDDLEVWYCGLGSNPSVKVGENVRAGQVIGAIADVPSETAEESHLHLEIHKDGQPVEPLAAIGQENKLPSAEE